VGGQNGQGGTCVKRKWRRPGLKEVPWMLVAVVLVSSASYLPFWLAFGGLRAYAPHFGAARLALFFSLLLTNAGLCAVALFAVVAMNTPADKAWRWSLDAKALLVLVLCLLCIRLQQAYRFLGYVGDASLGIAAIALLAIVVVFWLGVRIRHGWKWPGVSLAHVLAATLFVLASAVAPYHVVRAFSWDWLLWAMLPVVLLLYAAAWSLRLVTIHRAEFAAQCCIEEQPAAEPPARGSALLIGIVLALSPISFAVSLHLSEVLLFGE